jgi:hypothetical protein
MALPGSLQQPAFIRICRSRQWRRVGGRILQPGKAFPMSGNGLLDVLSEVVPQLPAVGDLICLWCAGGGAVGIRAGTIAADDPTARMLTWPYGESGRLPVQHIDRPMRGQVDEHRAIDMATS